MNKLEKRDTFVRRGTTIFFDNCKKSIDLKPLFESKSPESTAIYSVLDYVQDIKDKESDQLTLHPIK